jgi:hypothetical protein
MNRNRFFGGWASAAAAFIVLLLTSCFGIGGPSFDIISCSENETLEPILQQFQRQTGIRVNMHYKGSVDVARKSGSSQSRNWLRWKEN